LAAAGADSRRLWALIAKEYWRKARRQLRTGYRWRYSGRTPERVLIAPPDLRLADPQIAIEIYHGRFPLCGVVIETAGRSPFVMDVSHRGWRKSLHGFRWLRHMRAAGTELAAANARALVSDWIGAHGGRISGTAWEPATTAKRIIAWLQHSSTVLQGAEFSFYRAFLRSLAMQIRYLRSVVREMPDGEGKLRARIALAYAALSLPAPPSALRNATRNLTEELERQILPDGGHTSRNPMAVVELLADLLPLRQTYANQAEAPPDVLISAVERMLPALRFFRHADGSLAHFNGMGVTVHERIAAILRHDDTAGAPLLHAPHSGYERLAANGTVVIADTGPPPPMEVADAAHAGCLSFELSSGRQQFIVNAGIDGFGSDDFRPLGRATAAHSTACVNDTSSARFNHSERISGIIGTPLIDGPRDVHCERLDHGGSQAFAAGHDGYVARFGLYHERKLALTPDGDSLAGIDRLIPQGVAFSDNHDIAIRFHLHPDVELFRDNKGRLVLAAPQADRWFFSCNLTPRVEESIFFAALGGPRRSRQIVLAFKPIEVEEVRWQFQRRRQPAVQPPSE
jgi:uncharacterized heparinase superfamily protein